MACPICNKESVPEYRPFCSKGCSDVDLHRWLTGSYVIPAEEAERVKRPFTRLESARSNTKGSGLGLAIVDRIVRGQNGEFRLAARTGGGLDACIELPAAPKA